MSQEIAKKYMAVLEVTGSQPVSEAGAALVLGSLSQYDQVAVLNALDKCAVECRGKLTLADIVQRIKSSDGRPSPNDAWAQLPKSEAETAFLSEEMMAAWYVVADMEDKVAARMAFLERYKDEVDKARQQGKPVKWQVSLGSNPHGREEAIRRAVETGKLRAATAQRVYGYVPPPEHTPALNAAPAKRLHGLVEKTTKSQKNTLP